MRGTVHTARIVDARIHGVQRGHSARQRRRYREFACLDFVPNYLQRDGESVAENRRRRSNALSGVEVKWFALSARSRAGTVW